MSPRGLPVFAVFFLWSFGTGANNLARPLFAASFGVPVLFVTLITSTNSVSHLISGPITGYLMDRFGRKPMLIAGLTIRGASLFAEYFADSYTAYLLLEFVGGLGVAVWTTGASILVADLTVQTNRGRAVALRSMSTRLGFVLGPVVGAALASAFGLRSIFVFNALTKVVIIVAMGLLIGETRPEAAAAMQRAPAAERERLPLRIFLTRQFVIISLVTFAVAMMSQGIFASLFPLYLKTTRGFTTGEIGALITVAGVSSLAVSFPNGMLVDRFGRKSTLVPGLVGYGVASALLALGGDFGHLAPIVVLYGLGESVCTGVSQVYAMDLAPENRRGAFLGVWSLLAEAGTAAAPLVVGFTAERLGFGFTFVAVGVALGTVATIMGTLGPDTRRRAIAVGPAGERAQPPAALAR
ncbi:MAG TPA: MFS transporter [Chloroflexota bacterium]|nr:MFS transporter [Chloroflexota bacterium]